MKIHNLLFTFIYLDILQFARWWKKRIFSNFLIAIAFLLVLSFVSVLLYASSYTYLIPLTRYEKYGLLTASYLVHATIVITLWLGISSSLINNLVFIGSKRRELDFLLTLPIRPVSLLLHNFLKSTFSSLLWSLVIFLPLGMVVVRLFGRDVVNLGIANVVFTMTSIVVISSFVGYILSWCLSKIRMLSNSNLFIFLLVLLVVLTTVFIIRLLLPSSLASLLYLPIDKFDAVFNSLPLNRYFLPTQYLVNLLFSGSVLGSLQFISFLLVLSTCIIYLSESSIIKSREKLVSTQRSLNPKSTSFAQINLVMKDLYGIIRNSSELGYGIFLIGMTLGFIYFFISSPRRVDSFSLSWYLFYVTAYNLRITFPLMAKEGNMSWFIFSKPFAPITLILNKLAVSFILSSPIFLSGIFLSFYTGLSYTPILGALVLTLLSSLLGNVRPNFSDSSSPEQISTSLMGLLCLFVSLGYIALITNFQADLWMHLLTVVFMASLFLLSIHSIKRYQF